MDRTTEEKINKDTKNSTINQQDLTDLSDTSANNSRISFFRNAHGTSSRIEHGLCIKQTPIH